MTSQPHSWVFFLSPFLALAIAAAAQDPEPAAFHSIVIDGEFEDWKEIGPVLTDPADAPDATIDFGEVRITHDDRFVHLLIDVGGNVNLQGMNGTAMILLDADGDSQTGRAEPGLPGVDIIIDCSPASMKRNAATGLGIALRSTTYQPPLNEPAAPKLNPYDIGMMFAPTYASRRFEVRFERGAALPQTPAIFQGERFSGKLVFLDSEKQVADETAVFVHPLTAGAKPQASSDDRADPLARGPGSPLRVMTWNVQRSAILSNREPFARTLRAINPDVILLQELNHATTAKEIMEFWMAEMPVAQFGPRYVALGGASNADAKSGDLRCAVVSRFPIQNVEALKSIALSDAPDRIVRTAAAIVVHDDRRILVMSIHLRCCGVIGGVEDEQRIAEANAIHDQIAEYRKANKVDGVIIAGDFNLVGSRDPLEIIAMGLDIDHSNLTAMPALQLDGLSNVTWADRLQPFTPGRLDFMLASDSRLKTVRSFAYDSRDLSERWRAHCGVQGGDTEAASDHLPIVADLAWIK